MKAIAYLLAWVAFLPALVSALDPAPSSALPAGWKYKGCYTDRQWDGDSASNGQTSPATSGVTNQPRALNGYFNRYSTNGGAACIAVCNGLNKGYTLAATNDNQCWCDTALAINGTNSGTPGWGILDTATTSCQGTCRGNIGEACGSGGATRSTQRVSVYEFGTGSGGSDPAVSGAPSKTASATRSVPSNQTTTAGSSEPATGTSTPRPSRSNLSDKAIIGFSVGLGVAFLLIVSGIVSILHHRRHDHQDRSVGAHIPIIARPVLTPLTPATKYGRTHEALVEPPEVEGNTIMFELQSPDGEKMMHPGYIGGERRI